MEEILSYVANIGFPIAIATYVIVTQDKIVSENTLAINKLVEKIEVLNDKIK